MVNILMAVQVIERGEFFVIVVGHYLTQLGV